ncbi:MAG: sensor histidine kinase [Vicinamibacteria bacterium]
MLALALLSGAVGIVVSLGLLWLGDYSPKAKWTFVLLGIGSWLALAFAAQNAVVRPLQTVANLLSALREEDFSFRGRGSGDDALSFVMLEINALAGTLREQRLGALEATALLRKVMEEIDVAVFTFDEGSRLRLVNRGGERALGRPAENLMGRTADELGLGAALSADEPRVLEMTFPAGPGRWEARVGTFRERGLPHKLLVLSNVSRALREEERQAWQRLIRVLGHELNNSLTPIRSIAGSLESLIAREPRPVDWDVDMRKGLSVIAARAEALGRFMEAYARLARLPAPQLQPMEIGSLVRRVAGLETRLRVSLAEGPETRLLADADQLEQLLINLVRNAADAAIESGGGVRAGWRVLSRGGRQLEVYIDDDGPGLSNTANLFVPFFTTKPGGSGIGLVLARQIAEAHGGALTLENRRGGVGCRAGLRLPL